MFHTHSFLAQIYYETMRNILPGEELLLGPKEPIVIDSSNPSTSIDEPPTNGITKLESAEDEDEEEDGVKCIKCDKVYSDIFL